MNKAELLKTIRNSLFNNQGTDVQSALSAAHSVIDTITDPASRIGALTAMHVVLNTVANAIEALPEPLAAPAAEVRIAPDNPAAGITDLESVIIRLIDARITQSPSLGDRINGQVSRCVDEMLGDAIDDIVHAKIDVKIEEALDDFADNRLDDEIQKYLDNSVDFTEIVRDEIKQNITFTVEVE
jgi:hypothetical protein